MHCEQAPASVTREGIPCQAAHTPLLPRLALEGSGEGCRGGADARERAGEASSIAPSMQTVRAHKCAGNWYMHNEGGLCTIKDSNLH